MQLTLRQYKASGVLVNKYQPFHNLMKLSKEGVKTLSNFTTTKLSIVPSKAVDITCQPSYDGTVNLIINDGMTAPKIVNSKFTKTGGNQFNVITRNQKNQTNIYDEEHLDSDTALFLTSMKYPHIHLLNVGVNGRLQGGNYTFYVKYCDEDYNETDIVAESGQIMVTKGTPNSPRTMSGALYNERTDKTITLQITSLDTSFKRIQLYYCRQTSDTNGVSLTECKKINKPYEFNDESATFIITGYEDVVDSSVEELNIQYNIVSSAQTQAQVQNMLFFGNITKEQSDNKDLATISYYIRASIQQKATTIGDITPNYTVASGQSFENTEYYNPKNVYYYLGYWPEEMYRMGVVYLMKDGSKSPVYNLRGCKFNQLGQYNYSPKKLHEAAADYNGIIYEHAPMYDPATGTTVQVLYDTHTGKPVLDKRVGSYSVYKTTTGTITVEGTLPAIQTNEQIAGEHVSLYADVDKKVLNHIEADYIDNTLSNAFGVFKNPEVPVYLDKDKDGGVHPLYYRFELDDDVKNALYERGVRGLMFVRQKRIPNILGQGLATGILDAINCPTVYDSVRKSFLAESFVNASDLELSSNFQNHLRFYKSNYISKYGLLSVDAMVTPALQSAYDGEEFTLKEQGTCEMLNNGRHFYQGKFTIPDNKDKYLTKTQALYLGEGVSVKVLKDKQFSTQLGTAITTRDFAMMNETTRSDVFRGIQTPFIATTSNSLKPNTLYNIMREDYNNANELEQMRIRGNDVSAFYAITDRYTLEEATSIEAYRGDCYSATVTIRMNRNFTDPDMPIVDAIMDKETWKKHYWGYNQEYEGENMPWSETKDEKTEYGKINRADLNAVPLGMWVTYKCLSNYNIGVRSIDGSHTEEVLLTGNERSFYPVRDMSTKSACKLPETGILNAGYNRTMGIQDNVRWSDEPYVKSLFDNRVMFSNIASTDEFKNGYRVFQGLSYKDIDRQFGAIVKLIAWGRDLLCVFEHGVGILPVNEKALQSTTTGQSIHLYGLGVLTSDVTVLSQDFGSIWKDSIVRTPMGVYGIDTYAKKIWRVQIGKSQVETISDLKVQRFLNENIQLSESDAFPVLAIKDVATHYNNYKGDVMFTFYNSEKECIWNLCYNERQNKWVTQYTWTPLLSNNINNQYYSFDQKQSEIYSIIYNNKSDKARLKTSEQVFELATAEDYYLSSTVDLTLNNYDAVTSIRVIPTAIETTYLDDSDVLHKIYTTEFPYVDDEGVVYKDLEWLLPIQETGGRTNVLTLNGSRLNQWFKQESGFNDHPVYIKVYVRTMMYINDALVSAKFNDVLGFLLEPLKDGRMILQKEKLLRNAFYVHGQAGVFDEINYTDATFQNQILPCKWYDKQEPFEFEFVVNGDEVGMHKIFNNLVILSNNVQPKELEIEVVGDVYNFNKKGIFRHEHFGEDEYQDCEVKTLDKTLYQASQELQNCKVLWDNNLNEYNIRLTQPMCNIKEYGRVFGNIHYKEDAWYVTFDPIKFKSKFLINNEEKVVDETQSTRLRDKYCRIRVKYTGENLVVITAIRTLYTLSYA